MCNILSVGIRVPQRNRTQRISNTSVGERFIHTCACACRERQICLRKVPRELVLQGLTSLQSAVCRAGQQAGCWEIAAVWSLKARNSSEAVGVGVLSFPALQLEVIGGKRTGRFGSVIEALGLDHLACCFEFGEHIMQ